MDAFIILLIVIVIICWACYQRRLATAAYGIASLDLFLRIVDFVSKNIGSNSISKFFSKFPNSLLWVADKYTDGIIYLIISWLFIILMIYFLFLSIVSFIKK